MKPKYLIAGGVCIVIGIVLLLVIFLSGRGSKTDGGPPYLPGGTFSTDSSESETAESGVQTGGMEFGPSSEATSEETDPGEPYETPVDFHSLISMNSDVCGWLQIPGSSVSYPVLQSSTDDSFYLTHTAEGYYSDAGSLFTEHQYNSRTFDDRVTIVYGHYTWNGTYFGSLQTIYSDDSSFRNCQEIIIYLPEGERHYKVFAAVPFHRKHIMYMYDSFREPEQLEEFLDAVYSVRAFGAKFDEESKANRDDKILVLSTCLNGDSSNRYLVLAKLVETVS